MKVTWKYFGSLFIALYLLSPMAGFALTGQNSFADGSLERSYSSVQTISVDPCRNLVLCEAEDVDADDFHTSCPCHLPSNLFAYTYKTVDTRFEILEKHTEDSYAYASIFVPPQ